MYDWYVRLTLVCWRVNEREKINVASLQVTDRRLFFVEIVLSATTASLCVKTTKPRASSANSFRDLSGRFEREMLKRKRLFVQLNVILPWSRARREDEYPVFFVCPLLPFVFWMTFLRGTKNKRNQMKRTLRKIACFRRMTLLNITCFQPVSRIVKPPLVKR